MRVSGHAADGRNGSRSNGAARGAGGSEIGGARSNGQNGLRGRRLFAHFPGVSCAAGNDQPARRADRGDFRLCPRPDVLAGRKKARLFVGGIRHVGPHVSARIVRGLQRRSHRRCPTQLAPTDRLNIRRMLAALGIPVLECEGFEADDILATVARLVEQAGGHVLAGDRRQRLPAVDFRPSGGLQHSQRCWCSMPRR